MATGEHIELLKKNEHYHDKGCVIKPCTKKRDNYRDNCYNYTETNLKRIYNKDFTQGQEFQRVNNILSTTLGNKYYRFSNKPDCDPRYTKDAWWIGGGKYAHLNYVKGKWPFFNQAHHILPAEALHNELNFWELRALQYCGYNINAGENLVYLPEQEREGNVMELPNHLGYHATYNRDVQQIVKKIKKKFSEARDPEEEGHHPVDEKDMPNLREMLIQWSKDELTEIVLAGKTASTSINAVSIFRSL